MIPKTLGITLDEALNENTDLKQAYDSDPEVRELIDIARKLEGTNRNAGTHAAGVVIANGPLTDYVPLQRVVRKGDDAGSRAGEAVVTTQWVMGDLEKVGLLKMDFLGLRTLTLLDNAVKLIEKTRGEKHRHLQAAAGRPGDVRPAAARRRQGRVPVRVGRHPRTAQAAEAGQHPRHHRLHGAVPSRPARRRHGGRLRQHQARPGQAGRTRTRSWRKCSAETYGVMVYQEQIMRILNRLGGIELSSAYACIKAISKKKHDIIDQRRSGVRRRGAGTRVGRGDGARRSST